MIQLPEDTRKALDKLVNKLKARETVSSISLFGSWSRGDATSSSDVDLLVVDNRDFGYEYVERLEQNGTLIDLNYVPQKWIIGPVPSEIDQKLHEAFVLYDRDWKFTNTKEQMMKFYYTPERLGIRTDAYLIDADIYLSRSTSAHARGDLESAKAFATLSTQIMLKTIIDVARLPISNSHYIEALKKAAQQLGAMSWFENYSSIAELDMLDQSRVEEKLSSFKKVWDETAIFARTNNALLESTHFKIRTRLQYYTTPAFLQGVVLRSQALLTQGAFGDAANYLFNVIVDLLENFAWLKAAEQNVRLDYTTLFRSLKGQKPNPSTIHKNAAIALGLENLDEKKVKEAVTLAKQVVLETRSRRRMLISQIT